MNFIARFLFERLKTVIQKKRNRIERFLFKLIINITQKKKNLICEVFIWTAHNRITEKNKTSWLGFYLNCP